MTFEYKEFVSFSVFLNLQKKFYQEDRDKGAHLNMSPWENMDSWIL